jgi:hypothetical protein
MPLVIVSLYRHINGSLSRKTSRQQLRRNELQKEREKFSLGALKTGR